MKTLYFRFLNICAKYPHQTAVMVQRAADSGPDLTCTFDDVRQRADAIAAHLLQAGIKNGDRCAIVAANSDRWLACSMGILIAGGVSVPLDTAFKASQITRLLLDSGSRVIFTDHKHFELVKESLHSSAELSTVKTILLDGEPVDGPHHWNEILERKH